MPRLLRRLAAQLLGDVEGAREEASAASRHDDRGTLWNPMTEDDSVDSSGALYCAKGEGCAGEFFEDGVKVRDACADDFFDGWVPVFCDCGAEGFAEFGAESLLGALVVCDGF